MTPYLELDRNLSTPLQTLKKSVNEFARQVLRPADTVLDRFADPEQAIAPKSPLWDVMRAAYAQRFHAALVPSTCGGLGLQGLALEIALEELGWGSPGLALAIAVAGFPFSLVAATGNRELIDELVTPFVNSTEPRTVGCWAITEPDHGSDQFMTGTPQFSDPKIAGQTIARREGDHYVISGQKSTWVSNGTIATHAVTFLAIDPSRGMAGNGVAFIPLNLPGVSKGKPLDKLGQRALNQGSIQFNNTRIPKRYLLFGPEAYAAALDQTLALTNAAMGAVFTGVARAAYEEALAYTKVRVQGGRPIAEHQLVQKRLFEMFTKVETCRALARAALAYNDGSQPPALEYSIASKVYCTQAAIEVADSALQLFGGKGLSRDCPIERIYRDARASSIEDGVNEILELVGARRLLDRRPE
jgi:alkylation response protein AidB-like acyl-CoA dehydrogenase